MRMIIDVPYQMGRFRSIKMFAASQSWSSFSVILSFGTIVEMRLAFDE